MTDAFSWLELYQKADGAASAIYPSPSLSLAPTRMRREDMHLDNAGKFHLKFTVAVPEICAALHDAGACRHVCKPYAVHPVVKERPFPAVREEAVLHYT